VYPACLIGKFRPCVAYYCHESPLASNNCVVVQLSGAVQTCNIHVICVNLISRLDSNLLLKWAAVSSVSGPITPEVCIYCLVLSFVHLQWGEAISLEPPAPLRGIDIGARKVRITIHFKAAVGTYIA
jgi:hypothetical protein